ncbi:MAG TPA: glutaredoxin family protein [Candidatus Limnocylindria bacterium]|nr:glutaredoxin family protein [Candidatus Limnocylindria bacterium]
MTSKLTLYSRKDCCLCDAMKAVIDKVAANLPLEIDEIDIDGSSETREKFADQVPLLFIDGRKAFKYRVTAKQLAKKLGRKPPKLFTMIAGFLGKGE